MELINKLKQFYIGNKSLIATLVFFTILGYGYFISNWAISIDSEFHTYTNDYGLGWIQQGRFFIPILNLISNFHIIPFWDDLIAVFLLVLSSLIWMITLETNKRSSHFISLIFGLLFVISPIYSFYLRFTSYNISIGVGILFISLAAYCLAEYFNNIKGNRKINFLLSCIYLLLAICTYQMFVVYYFSGLLLIILASALGNDDSTKAFKLIITKLFVGMLVLVIGLCAYKILSTIIYHFIPASNYTDNFIEWRKVNFFFVLSELKSYFQIIFFTQKFNWLIPFTLVCSLFYIIYLLLINNYRNIHIVILVVLFLISPFIMILAFGRGMPLRTLQPVPLMLAGMWVLFAYTFNSHKFNRVLLFIVAICSLFNSQDINRLFYGDNMRLEYDKNFANQLYNYVILNTGDSIHNKPLAIVGMHSYSDKPFILKSGYDTIGASFFEWDGGNYFRMNTFMQWFGDDYIVPSEVEQASANELSVAMPSYPAKGSLKETESLIILKLSPAEIGIDQVPINLDLHHYSKLSDTSVVFNFESLTFKNNQLNYVGWAYIKQFNGNTTNMFIKFSNSKDSYVFPASLSVRSDVAGVYKDGQNLQNSGFYGTLNNKMKHGNYKVFLILVNGNNYAEVNSGKTIDL